MTSAPRIIRSLPEGPVTRPERGVPVRATIRWHHGRTLEVEALATAWTRRSVEVQWETAGMPRRCDWIPAHDVERRN